MYNSFWFIYINNILKLKIIWAFIEEIVNTLYSDHNYGKAETKFIMPFCKKSVENFVFSKIYDDLINNYKFINSNSIIKINENNETIPENKFLNKFIIELSKINFTKNLNEKIKILLTNGFDLKLYLLKNNKTYDFLKIYSNKFIEIQDFLPQIFICSDWYKFYPQNLDELDILNNYQVKTN